MRRNDVTAGTPNRDTGAARQAQRDYYEVLGVPRDADTRAIKQAFRARARELHPDISTETNADARFTELAQAYSVLSRPTKRMLYDRFGYLGQGHGGFDATQSTTVGGANSATEDAFDFTEIQVEFVEAVRGATRKVEVTTVGICTSCRGTGAATGSRREECARCRGEGRLRRAEDVNGGRVLQIDDCPDCDGTGSVVIVPCPQCLGSGRETLRQKVKVEIPAGAEDGKMIRAKAEPKHASNGRRRDVYVVLRVLPDRDSRVVRYTATVALALALGFFALLLAAPELLDLPG